LRLAVRILEPEPLRRCDAEAEPAWCWVYAAINLLIMLAIGSAVAQGLAG